jgi:hypothetical protein
MQQMMAMMKQKVQPRRRDRKYCSSSRSSAVRRWPA